MIQVNLKWLNNWKANLLPIAGVAVLLAILFLYPKIEMQKRAPEATPGPSSAYKLNENLGPLSGKSNEARQQITAKVTREVGDELVYSAEGVQVLYLIRNDIFKVGITKGPFEEIDIGGRKLNVFKEALVKIVPPPPFAKGGGGVDVSLLL